MVGKRQRHEGSAVVEPSRVQNRNHPRVHHFGAQGDLAGEPRPKTGMHRQIAADDLERHHAAEEGVLRLVDGTRRALTEFTDEFVAFRELGRRAHGHSERKPNGHSQFFGKQ